ncbi:translesion error-prone DNA polymerase V subunit UmuC [Marinobacter halodurans]|uniref:Translesion error-prone DNA polymerase V subunit UmuC n=1 Tax=Marinobacter halodurans TaxID=2528979 RepID=A0ABY1ZRA3_9GAMM|nr:translesion error-prone DNA polymerase V subunit UmuC [Marinobacter halodurans]TBW57395.1 translesion error-prone DNA polymerase V subunit UmuC [Marinobacter halodurans]
MRPACFALVDVDNFYVSCERVFDPSLNGRPVIVVGNNDQCCVARSSEVKAIGIKMGEPLFKLQPQIQRHGIIIRSSNYSLYGAMSARFSTILSALAPTVLEYSIDEAFLDLTSLQAHYDLSEHARGVKQTVLRWTGLPVCVGFSTSLTLAKLASRAAKKYPAARGVVDLTDPARQRRLMAITPVGDIWGVGPRIARKLRAMGIESALQLADTDPSLIRSRFSVVMERTVRDLQGEAHHRIETSPPAKGQIICSKSFGTRVTELADMLAAVTSYVVRAAEKLRSEKRVAGRLSVFLMTSRFLEHGGYSNEASSSLERPTADTRNLIVCATRLTRKLWKDGHRFTKAGVMLTDFRDPLCEQHDLFSTDARSQGRSQALMDTLDCINGSGLGRIQFARQRISEDSWGMKRERLSPNYLSRWSDIPEAK